VKFETAMAVNEEFCHKIKQQTLESQNTTIFYYIYSKRW